MVIAKLLTHHVVLNVTPNIVDVYIGIHVGNSQISYSKAIKTIQSVA